MKILVNILKYIIIILLTACIIALGLVNIVSSNILSKDYVLGKLESTNYYEEINKKVQEAFEEYIGPSGFDEDIMEGLVSIDKIKQDTDIIISNIYDGTNAEISTESIEINLRDNITKSLDGRTLTATEQKAIDQYVNKITKQYIDTMFHTSFEDNINGVLNKVNGMIGTANIALIIGTVVLIVLLVLFNMKNIIEAVSNIGISFTASGIFYIFLNIYINSEIKVANITVINSAFSTTLRAIINDLLGNILIFGIILSVLGVAAIVVGHMKNNNKKVTSSNKEGKRSK